jgi:hypothetical protein
MLYTIAEIAKEVNRGYSTVNERMTYRMKLNPVKEQTNGFIKRKFYNDTQRQQVIDFYSMKELEHKDKLPDVIYITRESHFFESKSNFWSHKKINDYLNSF